MSYIDSVLFDGEKVQHRCHVHWIVYMPGLFTLLLSIFIAFMMPKIGAILNLDALEKNSPWLAAVPELVTGGLFLHGAYKLLKAFLIATFTELVVTTHRIIAKFGIYSTTTIEMDKHKIAGMTIHQSITGNMLDYGHIFLRGFANSISGLPVIAKPYEIQKYTSSNRFM